MNRVHGKRGNHEILKFVELFETGAGYRFVVCLFDGDGRRFWVVAFCLGRRVSHTAFNYSTILLHVLSLSSRKGDFNESFLVDFENM